MSPALKAVLGSFRALCLALLAGGVAGSATNAPAAIGTPTEEDGSVLEGAAWDEARRVNTPEAYQHFLELFPIGFHAEEAFRLLIERSFVRQPVPRLVDPVPPLTPDAPAQARVVAAADLALY